MNQSAVGKYINLKRKEKNLTQIQLAEKLGISNKTISKWENGKCLPDYSLMENLCGALDITVAELMDGADADHNSIRIYDEKQIMDLVRRVQELERQKLSLYGMLLVVLGIVMFAVSRTMGGSDMKDFISGILFGVSIGEMLVGAYCAGRSFLAR